MDLNKVQRNFKYLALLCMAISCNKNDGLPSHHGIRSHIEYFGFTIIDTYWDDPTDAESKTNYADEIRAFSNLADILVVSAADDMVARAQAFADLELKAVLHLNNLFFELIDSNSASGANYDLRTDYRERWDEFRSINESILDTAYIGAFYIGEEPTWNGITFSEMKTIADLLETEFPEIPSMLIEAYPVLHDLQVPESVDWVGFDRYFIKKPNTDTGFQLDWDILKSKLSGATQRIMVVMDSHYIDWAHGDFGNITIDDMGTVAHNYYDLAKSDEKVIGILGYFWPNGFDVPESIGARGMPAEVQEHYISIGKEITGKQ